MGQTRHDAAHVDYCDGVNHPDDVASCEGLGVLLNVSRSRWHTALSGFETLRRETTKRWHPSRSAAIAASLSLILSLGIGAAGLAQDSGITQRLFAAVQKNDLARVQIAVADGADIHARNNLGLTALDLAVDKGHFEIAHYLISVRDIQSQQAAPAADAGSPPPLRIEDPAPKPSVPATAGTNATPPPPADTTARTVWPQAVPNPFEANAVPPGARHPVVGESPPPGMPALPPGVTAEGETEPSGLQPQAGEFIAPFPRAGGFGGPATPPPSRPGVERSRETLPSPAPPRFEPPPPKPDLRDDAAEMPVGKPDPSPSAMNSMPSTTGIAVSEALGPATGSWNEAQGSADKSGGEGSGTWTDQIMHIGTRIVAHLEGVLDGSWLKASESPVRVVIDLPPRVWPIGTAHAEGPEAEPGDVEPDITRTSAHGGVSTPEREAGGGVEARLAALIQDAVDMRPASGGAGDRERQAPHPRSTTRPLDAVEVEQNLPDDDVIGTVRFVAPPPKPARVKPKEEPALGSIADTPLSPVDPAGTDESSGNRGKSGMAPSIEEHARPQAPSPAYYDPGRPPETGAFAEARNPFVPGAVAPGSRYPVVGETLRVVPPPPKARFFRVNSDMDAFPRADARSTGGLGNIERRVPEGPVEGSDLTDLVAAPGEQLAQATSDDRAAADAGADASNARDSGPFVPLGATPRADDGAGGEKIVMVPPVPANLSEDVPSIGQTLRLTVEMPPEPEGSDDPRRCVRRQRGAVHFCVEPVDWPPDLLSRLRISTVMYQGAGAIVRYDEGRASRMHAVFPAEEFESVAAYYQSRFGAPDEVVERQIAPFAQARRANMTAIWRRQDPATERQITLEIRNFDDARGGFPDLRHGAILLYDEVSPPIFPVLSPLDLMPTRRR